MTPSVRGNAVANYASQIVALLAGLVMVPFYLRYLGPEAYGLVGFLAVLQTWGGLLDMGLSPSLARQFARMRGGAEPVEHGAALLRTTEAILAGLSLLMAAGTFASSGWIAREWLHAPTLSDREVATCVSAMGILFGARWFAALYRAGIQGFERHIWLGTVSGAAATVRAAGSAALLLFVTREPTAFFLFQAAIGLLEAAVLRFKMHGLMPTGSAPPRFSISRVRAILPFAGPIAYTSALWLLMTQTDKLILSHLLRLDEFGYYNLAASVAGSILLFSGPIAQAILPRMTLLLARGDQSGMLGLYRTGSQFVSILVFPVAGSIALFAPELLGAWTGDARAADFAALPLAFLALGNGILAVAAFQYYLQVAHGQMQWHMTATTVNVLIQAPALALAAFWGGAQGAATAWLAIRFLSFWIWPPIAHRKFAPGLHWGWLRRDIGIPFLSTCAALAVACPAKILLQGASRPVVLAGLAGIGLAVLAVNAVVAPAGRALIRDVARSLRATRQAPP